MSDVLTRIKLALGLLDSDKKTELATEYAVTGTLSDGTTIGADAFEVGNTLYIVAADGTSAPATEGTYETADMILTTDVNGVIANVEVKQAEAEELKDVETPKEDKGEDPKKEGTASDEDKQFKETVMAILETLTAEVGNLKTKMEEMAASVCKTDSKMEKLAKAPGTERIKHSVALKAIGTEAAQTFDKKLEILKEIRNGLYK